MVGSRGLSEAKSRKHQCDDGDQRQDRRQDQFMTVVAQQVLQPKNARFHARNDLILRSRLELAIECRRLPDRALPRDTRARIPNVAKITQAVT